MITGQLACRIFYVYYLAMGYMWLAKPADMLENFDYIETDNATALNVGRWMGSAFAILSCVFMAAAQLEFAAQKKILQYQTVGLCTCIYMAQQGKELIKDTAPMNKNFGLYLCCVLTFLSIYPATGDLMQSQKVTEEFYYDVLSRVSHCATYYKSNADMLTPA